MRWRAWCLVAWSLVACRDRARATLVDAEPPLDASCPESDPVECRQRALREIDRRAYRNAVALATRGCEGGHLPACRTLGWLHENGHGTPRDLARARALYTRGCDGGELGSCKSLGFLMDTGQGGPVDRAGAARLYERACEGGELGACSNLANLLASGDGVARDAPRALTLYERVCQRTSNDRACSNARSIRAVLEAESDASTIE